MIIVNDQTTLLSTPLPASKDGFRIGWQEIQAFVLRDVEARKNLKHRFRAEIDKTNSAAAYGEVAVWAGSRWKQIARVPLETLPKQQVGRSGENAYRAALDTLYNLGVKVVAAS